MAKIVKISTTGNPTALLPTGELGYDSVKKEVYIGYGNTNINLSDSVFHRYSNSTVSNTLVTLQNDVTTLKGNSSEEYDNLGKIETIIKNDKEVLNNLSTSKANATDVYTKTEVNTQVNAKANITDVYTKNEINTQVNSKANTTDVYTKTEVNDLVQDIDLSSKLSIVESTTPPTTEKTLWRDTDTNKYYISFKDNTNTLHWFEV